MKKGVTIRQATEDWIRSFNAISTDIIEHLDEGYVSEITEITIGSRVYAYNRSDANYGEVIKETPQYYIVELDNGQKARVPKNELELDPDGYLPMWSTLWEVSDSADDYWMEELGGVKTLSSLGFRVYDICGHTYFGIDGCGFDFYRAYWIPLYKARGLQWHDPELENEEDY